MKKFLLLIAILAAACGAAQARKAVKTDLGRPDLEAIRVASTDEKSPYFYPKLLEKFMANDTLMSDTDFQYFYYGTLFQEDYDPYRPQGNTERRAQVAPLMNKNQWSRAERKQIFDFAMECLADNPINLRQLTNRIFVYEQNGKNDLARIWQNKLNHLLLVIASSGSGADPENAWVVAYPQDEHDFLNLSGITVKEAKFEQPYYDHIVVNPKTPTSPAGYYFNIGEILRQYYRKHPSERSE